MTPCDLEIGGERVLLDPSGALFWPRARMLVVADLHLEKSTAYDRHGLILPPYDSTETLAALDDALARHNPVRLIALGDSFHDSTGWHRLPGPERGRISTLCARIETIWLRGNHDPQPDPAFPGRDEAIWQQGPFLFRHEPTPHPPKDGIEVAGHLHPSARMTVRGQPIRRPCFVAARNRLILPAFGAYTGSLDVSDAAFNTLLLEPHTVFLRGRQRVYRFARKGIDAARATHRARSIPAAS